MMSTISDMRSLPSQQRRLQQEQLDFKLGELDDAEEAMPALRAVHSNRGFSKFCDALKSHPSLTDLHLGQNRLGDQNARILSYAIFWSRKPRISKLELQGNSLEEPPRNLVALAQLSEEDM